MKNRQERMAQRENSRMISVMKSLIRDLPRHKLEQVINEPTFVRGLWSTLTEGYKIPFSKENHEVLVDLVQDQLEGPNLEREWSEREYNTFVKFELK
jgi:hypothetical protein